MISTVVGCGKAKLDHAAPAQDLYTGSLFRAARRYAEACGGPWLILSAKYGVLEPSSEIEPYDQVLELQGAELQGWAMAAAIDIIARLGVEREIELLMGQRYAGPVAYELRWLGACVGTPLGGRGLGERLSWLKRHAAGYRGEAGR